MTSGMGLFAVFGLLFAVAALACGMARALLRGPIVPARFPPAMPASTAWFSSDAWRAGARLCLGLSCLFAVAAFAESWSPPRDDATVSDAPMPSAAWGALWVYTFALLVEWRRSGLAAAGTRAFAGILLAGGGVLLLGVCLQTWAAAAPPLPCGDAGLTIYVATDVQAAAALGLALVPLAGAVLPFASVKAPPLSSAAASVAMGVWLQPALPALEWLPVSVWAGAALAALLVAALALVGVAATRGPWATATGLTVYYAVSVGGCLGLGAL